MRQKFLVLFLCLLALAAEAQLSANPWLEANDDEDIQQVYKKEQRRRKLNAVKYQAEEAVTIDRTSAYIQPEEMQEEKGVLDKVKDIVSGNKEETQAPLPATSYNKQAIEQKKAQQRAKKQAKQNETNDSSFLPSFGIDKQMRQLKNKFKLPKMPNANGVIQQIEKASGINFKSLGKSLR